MTSLPKFSVNNPVLVGLLTWTLLIGGVYSGLTMVREMFPEMEPHRVMITAVYPGASPAEIEKGIAIKVEEVVKDIEEIEDLRTTIGEGFCNIVAMLYNGVDDADQVVTDIKAAIDTIPREDFPEEAEEIQVTKLEPKLPVISVNYFGRLEERALKNIGEQLRDDLLAIPGISDVLLEGTRQDEITVEIAPETLIEHGLSLPEVADVIARANLDLPGGQIRTASSNIAVRTLGEEDEARALGDIIVRGDSGGSALHLREIATLIDGFEDTDVRGRFNALPAVSATVFKTASQDAISISNKVKALVAGKTGQPLERNWLARIKYRLGIRDEIERVYEQASRNPYPLDGQLKTSTNLARFIEGRLDLLKRNGCWGLFFVFLSLLLFLNWRVAFWVMAGLLLAILGTLMLLHATGSTLNLISVFGLIVVLGLLVDDAIVIGEHIFTLIENGMEPKQAAIQGAEDVTWPVTCAIATTIVAFAPLLFIQGQIGDFMSVLPFVVMCALGVSLFEALAILPSHLAEWVKPMRSTDSPKAARGLSAWAARFRSFGADVLRTRLQNRFERVLRVAVSYRYVTMAALLGVLIVSLGFVAGGRVPIVFVQKMDSETLLADIKLGVGTPLERTDRAVSIVEQAAMELPELDSLYSLIGLQINTQGETAGMSSHLGQLIIELKPIEERERNSEEILRELRAKTSDIPGVDSVKFSAIQGGPGGKAIEIEISGQRTADIVKVAHLLKKELTQFTGVFDIDDDFDAGRREAQIELLQSARAVGLTTLSLATQIRGAFYGLEARKVQRRREDVKIMVRFPPHARRAISDIEQMWVATDSGHLVPFTEVARLREGRAFATIKRLNQMRTVTVSADVDQAVGNPREISNEIAAMFPALETEFPGVTLDFGGQKREFAKSFGSLKRDFLIAAALIYVILAGLFKSYLQPVIVMAAIPFGFIGAVAGHFAMGYPMTIMSLIGLVALTGIVVNDSLILVNWINRLRAEGMAVHDAVVRAARERMRAILLTSITTILGLAPLLFETSFQARFLIPMGISIAAGVAFATVLTLVAVPSLYLILEDFKSIGARFRSFFSLTAVPIEQRV